MTIKLGYARVSTFGQHTDNQVSSLTEAGAAEVFEETITGKSNTHSVVFRNLFDRVRELREDGEEVQVIVTKLDRFGRNSPDVVRSVIELAEMGASFRSLDGSIDYQHDNPMSRFQLQILSAVNELERSFIVAVVSSCVYDVEARRASVSVPGILGLCALSLLVVLSITPVGSIHTSPSQHD